MSSKMLEIVKSVDPNDEVLNTYPGELDRKYGTLVSSNNRLLFVKEEGFLKKSYTTTLNHLYNEVKSIVRKGGYIEFTDMNDKVYSFKSDVSAPIVEEALRKLIKTPQ